MAKDWKYGNAWESFPIKDREIWHAGPHRLGIFDVQRDDLSGLLAGLDPADTMLYSDPPWNQGNSAAFFTKAKKEGADWEALIRRIIAIGQQHAPACNYMEMGFQNIDRVKAWVQDAGATITNHWKIVYYRKLPMDLIRYTWTGTPPLARDLTGIDDDITAEICTAAEPYGTVIDPCTGIGCTGRSAHKAGKRFIGSELNRRRAANLLEHFAKVGLQPKRA